jgi:hypothetical protein
MNNRTLNRAHNQTDARRRPGGASTYRRSSRPQLIADGVIAGYIHDISARHRPGDAVSSRAMSRTASRLRLGSVRSRKELR